MTDTVDKIMGDAIQSSRILHLMREYDTQLMMCDILLSDEKTTQGEALVAIAAVFARRICAIADNNKLSRDGLLCDCLTQVSTFVKGAPN
jgi:hypothetical protein